ncbi:MAG: hypothetical protein QW118_05985 [Nitrososphaerota archaeon]
MTEVRRYIYYVDYSRYGDKVWNGFCGDGVIKEIIEEIEKYGKIRPNIYVLSSEETLNFIELCRRLSIEKFGDEDVERICEIVKPEKLEILEKED